MPRDAVKAPIAALRQQLADEILRLVDHLPTVISANLLCIDERRMADLRHGRAQRFSVERLIRMLAQINRRVDLTVVNTGPPIFRWFGILRDRKRNFRPEAREVSLPKHQVEQ
jgi:predicted XRE-type DNA-binding protein